MLGIAEFCSGSGRAPLPGLQGQGWGGFGDFTVGSCTKEREELQGNTVCIQQLLLTIRGELLIRRQQWRESPCWSGHNKTSECQWLFKRRPHPKFVVLLQERDSLSPHENSNGFLGVRSRFN